MLFVLPGDVCVDVTAQIKTQLKEWTWELARVAEGMKEWAVIFKVCPHSPNWKKDKYAILQGIL